MRSNIRIDIAQRSLGFFTALLPRITPTIGARDSRIALAQLSRGSDISLSVARNGLFLDAEHTSPVINSAATALRLYRAGVTRIELPQGISRDQIGDTFFELSTASLPKLEREFGQAGIGLEIIGSPVRMPFTWKEFYRDSIASRSVSLFSPLAIYRNYRHLSDFLNSSTPDHIARVIGATAGNSQAICSLYMLAVGESAGTAIIQTLFRQGVVGQHPLETGFRGNILTLATDTTLPPSTVAQIISRYLPKSVGEKSHYKQVEIMEDVLYGSGVTQMGTGRWTGVPVIDAPARYSDSNFALAARIINLHLHPIDVLQTLLSINETLTTGILPLILSEPKEAARFICMVTPKSILQKRNDPDNLVYDHDGSHETIHPGTPIGYSQSDFEKAAALCCIFPIDSREEIIQNIHHSLAEGMRSSVSLGE